MLSNGKHLDMERQAREETYPNMPDMSFHLVTPLRCPIRTYPHVIPFEFKSDFHDDFPSFWQCSRVKITSDKIVQFALYDRSLGDFARGLSGGKRQFFHGFSFLSEG